MTRSVQTLLIVDTETTGIDAQQDRLIEIGAVLFSVPHRSVMQQLSFLLPTTTYAMRGDSAVPGVGAPVDGRSVYADANDDLIPF